MTKLLFSIIGYLIIMGVGILVMIHGWGVELRIMGVDSCGEFCCNFSWCVISDG